MNWVLIVKATMRKDHDFKPKDVVRLYKIPLVKDNTTVFFK